MSITNSSGGITRSVSSLPPLPGPAEAPAVPANAGRTETPRAPSDATLTGPGLRHVQSLAPLPRSPSLPAPAISTPTAPPARTATRIVLSGSVGRGGENHAGDVAQIQRALVKASYLPADFRVATDAAAPDHIVEIDAETLRAIERYQAEVVGMRRPDGRIDIDRDTLATLNGDRRPRVQRTRTPSTSATSRPELPTVPAPVSDSERHITRAELVSPNPDAAPYATPARSGPHAPTRSFAPTTERLIDGPRARDLTEVQAYAELDRLGIPYRRLGDTLGISDPVRVEYPLLGVEFPYVDQDDRNGRPTRTFPRESGTMDVRYLVALVHTIQHIQAQGETTGWHLKTIYQLGTHVTHRNGQLHTGQHPRGLAMDMHSFQLVDANGREINISVPGDWRTARSSGSDHSGEANVQTAEEVANMSVNEAWLRQLWGFMRTEYDVVLTPSHNADHTNHFHPDLHSTARQDARSRASLAAHRATGHDDHA